MGRFRALSFPAAAALAAALAAGAAAPAAAQRISGANAQPKIVLQFSESYAHACYRYAASDRADDHALDVCDEALSEMRSRSERAGALVNRGVIRQLRGELDEALADFDSALALEPTLAEGLQNRGGVYLRLGRWEDARRDLDEAIALMPAPPAKAYFGRAVAREEVGDIEGAYADYQAAARLDPEWEAPRLELERFQLVDS